jgi:D-alanyl-D-alanine carboxypeptidase
MNAAGPARTNTDPGRSLRVDGPYSAKLDALFADCAGNGPGLVLAVLRANEVIHRAGYGMANVEDGVPFTPQTVLHLGSTTKHMTAICALLFEDRGAWSLTDPITHWVDGLPAFYEAITLEHLLSMRSGLPDGLNLGLLAGVTVAGLDSDLHLGFLRGLAAPMFAPGEGLTYSNSNYFLLSLAIERVAGEPLAQVMRRALFQPLGMTATALISDPSVAIAHKARGYAIDADGCAKLQPLMAGLCGDGGVVTTIEDYTRWAKAYAGDHFGARRRLETEGRVADGALSGYGLGMGVSRVCALAKVAHGGGMPGYLAEFAYVPEADTFVLWLANRMDPRLFDLTDKAIATVVDRMADAPPPPAVLKGVRGVYVEHGVGCTAEFETTEEGTVLHVMGERLIPCDVGDGVFRPTKTSAYFPFRLTDRVRDGRPVLEMKLSTAQWRELTPWTEADADGVRLSDYVGAYRSALLGETHYVEQGPEGLEISLKSRMRALLWRALKPRGQDLFSAVIAGEPSDTDVTIIFRRDSEGRTIGFDYNLSRTRGVRFERA